MVVDRGLVCPCVYHDRCGDKFEFDNWSWELSLLPFWTPSTLCHLPDLATRTKFRPLLEGHIRAHANKFCVSVASIFPGTQDNTALIRTSWIVLISVRAEQNHPSDLSGFQEGVLKVEEYQQRARRIL